MNKVIYLIIWEHILHAIGRILETGKGGSMERNANMMGRDISKLPDCLQKMTQGEKEEGGTA